MDFELCVMDPDGTIVGVRAAVRDGDLDDSTFRLVVGGRDLVGEAWNLGPLERMTAQFEAAAERLATGREALVRSAVEDQNEVPWFLFEPRARDVWVSAFVVPDRSLAGAFPIPVYASEQVDAVYRYVTANRVELLSRPGPDLFRDVRVPRAPLLTAVRREVAAARVLLARG